MAILTGYDQEQVHSVSVWNPPPQQRSHHWQDRPRARSYLDQRVAHPHPTTRRVPSERSTRSNPTSLPIRFVQTSAVDPTRSATSTGPAEIAGPSASTWPGWSEPSRPSTPSCPDHVDPVDPESSRLHQPATPRLHRTRRPKRRGPHRCKRCASISAIHNAPELTNRPQRSDIDAFSPHDSALLSAIESCAMRHSLSVVGPARPHRPFTYQRLRADQSVRPGTT